VGGQSAETNDATTLVVFGHTSDMGASSVQFDGQNGAPVTASVGKSGYFIVGTTVPGMMCGRDAWAPTFHVLDTTGHQLSATTLALMSATKWVAVGSGRVCIATAAGPGARVTPAK
jgi:hypothetical protein